MKNILIVDRNATTLQTLAGLIQGQSGMLNILTAGSVSATLEAIAHQPVHMVIIGVQLPELDSFELVTKLVQDHPLIRIIVMTNNASPMFRTQLKKIPSAVHFDQLRDINLLFKRILAELQIIYGGRISGVSLASFLQMMELEKSTCTLLISAKGRSGQISISRGVPIAAECGNLRGKAAAIHILTWENGVIEVDFTPHAKQHEFTKPLMKLILESGRVIDERKLNKTDNRMHQRINLLVAVDYDLSDWTHQCYLQDISLGGAYIETSQQLAPGQKIVLTLSSSDPDPENRCTINGIVVRRDSTGIGVHFEDLSMKQKTFIEGLGIE